MAELNGRLPEVDFMCDKRIVNGGDGGAALVSEEYDVFISYNSKDRDQVTEIVRRLTENGIRPFIDHWDLRQGELWQPELRAVIQRVPSAAIFIGKDGVGPWQFLEAQSLMNEGRQRPLRLCSVLLRGVIAPQVPPFYENFTEIDFRPGGSNGADPFETLKWAITGFKASVFVAYPTDDVRTSCDRLKKNLANAQFKVEFLNPRPYEDVGSFEKAVEAKIKECKLFVQVIGLQGERPEYLISQGRLVKRLEEQEIKITMLTWQRPDLPMSELSESYVDFLKEETRSTEPFDDFIKAVLNKASIEASSLKEPDPIPERRRLKVFVNWEAKDQDRGRKIADIIEKIPWCAGEDLEEARLLEVLKRQNWWVYLNNYSNVAASARKQREYAHRNCDRLFIVYGNSPQRWVIEEVDFFSMLRTDWLPEDPYAICKVPPRETDWRKSIENTFRFGTRVFVDCGEEINPKKIYKCLVAFLKEGPMPDEI